MVLVIQRISVEVNVQIECHTLLFVAERACRFHCNVEQGFKVEKIHETSCVFVVNFGIANPTDFLRNF